jgi:hypothetical protein
MPPSMREPRPGFFLSKVVRRVLLLVLLATLTASEPADFVRPLYADTDTSGRITATC